MRALIGLVKGLIVGGLAAYGLIRLGLNAEAWAAYAATAAAGALTGIVAGRAPWKSSTLVTPVIKAIVGGAVGAGLCALGRHLLPNPELALASLGTFELHSGVLLAPIVAALYGVFVEIDDGGPSTEGESGSSSS